MVLVSLTAGAWQLSGSSDHARSRAITAITAMESGGGDAFAGFCCLPQVRRSGVTCNRFPAVLVYLVDHVQRTPAHLVVDPSYIFTQQSHGDKLNAAQGKNKEEN